MGRQGPLGAHDRRHHAGRAVRRVCGGGAADDGAGAGDQGAGRGAGGVGAGHGDGGGERVVGLGDDEGGWYMGIKCWGLKMD